MKGKKNKKVVKKAIPLTKSLNELMKDEDGFVSKENILKIGLSTVAALGVVGALSEKSHAQHTNVLGTKLGETCHTNETYTY